MQIYTHFKDALSRGRIAPGQKLDSIRTFAAKHGLSATTVEKAYTQLSVEGYIRCVPKSGTYAETVDRLEHTVERDSVQIEPKPSYKNLGQHPGTFDAARFKKHIARVLSSRHDDLMKPGDAQGEWELRREVAHFLTNTREVRGDAGRIVIGAGVQNHLMTLGSLLKHQRVAFLKPLFERARHVFELLGYELRACKTFDDLFEVQPSLIYISPSNLYPGGGVVGIGERQRLIRYASTHDALIIEDDYNHMFRYNAYQIPSIQGLAGGEHVVYIGSFSRPFLISMRLGYMVLPPTLLKRYLAAAPLAQTVSKLDQLAMAETMKSGDFMRQLKRIAVVSRKQNDALRETLDALPARTDITLDGIESNLHVLIRSDHDDTIRLLKKKAKALKLFVHAFEDPENTLLVPYAGLSEEELKFAFKTLLDP